MKKLAKNLYPKELVLTGHLSARTGSQWTFSFADILKAKSSSANHSVEELKENKCNEMLHISTTTCQTVIPGYRTVKINKARTYMMLYLKNKTLNYVV